MSNSSKVIICASFFLLVTLQLPEQFTVIFTQKHNIGIVNYLTRDFMGDYGKD